LALLGPGISGQSRIDHRDTKLVARRQGRGNSELTAWGCKQQAASFKQQAASFKLDKKE